MGLKGQHRSQVYLFNINTCFSFSVFGSLKNLMLPFSQKTRVSFLFHLFLKKLIYFSLSVPRPIPHFCWDLFFSNGSETKAGAEDPLDILEDFPCLPRSGSVHFEIVHGDRGPSDVGMFSTSKTQEGGKLCAGIINCTRLAASGCRTAAAVGSSRGNGGRWLVQRMRRLCLQATEQPGWTVTNLGVVLSDGVKDRNITGHMAVIFDW